MKNELSISNNESTILKAYRQTFITNDIVTANALFRNKYILKHFHFLGIYCDDIITINGILALPLLADQLLNISFDQILKNIFLLDNCDKYKIRFYRAIKSFGTIFINNIYILSKIVDVRSNFDLIIRLDHTKTINLSLLNYNPSDENYLHRLSGPYSIGRVFKILLTYKHQEFQDIIEIMKDLNEILGKVFLTDIKKYCGNKSKSFEDIHNEIITSFFGITYFPDLDIHDDYYDPTKDLVQELLFLEGEKLFEFTISVPKTVGDLRITGKTLRHCVAVYDRDVIFKNCQIINLTLNVKLMFTLELKKVDGHYRVVQFRGYNNSTEYEGDVGLKHRLQLEKMIRDRMRSTKIM